MLSVTENRIISMQQADIDKVGRLADVCLRMPQVNIETSHLFHAGMYARTIMIPEGTTLTGALIKIATLLIVSGEVLVYTGDDTVGLRGYNVLAASKNRKQAFYALTDTWMTMMFPSDVSTVADAEMEFTSEPELLMSRKFGKNDKIIITGE